MSITCDVIVTFSVCELGTAIKPYNNSNAKIYTVEELENEPYAGLFTKGTVDKIMNNLLKTGSLCDLISIDYPTHFNENKIIYIGQGKNQC